MAQGSEQGRADTIGEKEDHQSCFLFFFFFMFLLSFLFLLFVHFFFFFFFFAGTRGSQGEPTSPPTPAPPCLKAVCSFLKPCFLVADHGIEQYGTKFSTWEQGIS